MSLWRRRKREEARQQQPAVDPGDDADSNVGAASGDEGGEGTGPAETPGSAEASTASEPTGPSEEGTEEAKGPLASTRAAQQCMSVDLPEPDGPITAVNSPAMMSSVTPSRARTSASPLP